MISINKEGCIRCGVCCHYLKDGVLTKCKHLVRLPNRSTVCRIYKTRIGTVIDKNTRCTFRGSSSFDYKGCPLNTGKEVKQNGEDDQKRAG